MRNPPGIDCEQKLKGLNHEGIKSYAYLEWQNFVNNYAHAHTVLKGAMNERINKGGYLSCFCDH